MSASRQQLQITRLLRAARITLGPASLALAASLLLGCDGATGPEATPSDVRLVSEQVRYRAGDVVPLAVVNESDRSVTGGLCPLSLQRLQQGRWFPVLPDTQGLVRACDAVRVLVQPGDTLALGMQLDARLPSGTYRIEHHNLRFDAGAALLELRTSPFDIVASDR